jgi:hypothetical protein
MLVAETVFEWLMLGIAGAALAFLFAWAVLNAAMAVAEHHRVRTGYRWMRLGDGSFGPVRKPTSTPARRSVQVVVFGVSRVTPPPSVPVSSASTWAYWDRE